ncbi:ribosome biogenesis GTPase Der [candidate division KSB1 bacterium]|nr:ribosome biogenesis GTPase Der [candidate division KSB1 bacterium]
MKYPVIAIVGRPNVGKSTLFNRISGTRKAITAPEPGVTRDRHVEYAEWNGRRALVMDTGGWVPKSADLFETAIREQVEFALDECDIALLVTDAQTGTADIDLEIARMLQRGKVPVLLAVNKVDGPKQDPEVGEFYSAGLGDPIPVSAISGRGVAELMDLLWSRLPTLDTETPSRPRPLVAVVGRPNVGKSSFVNAILGENRHIVTDVAGTTRDAIDSEVAYYGQRFTLIDTAGLRRRTRVEEALEFYTTVRTRKAVDECDVAVVLIDARDGLVAQDVRIVQEAEDGGKGIVIAINKWDLVEKDSHTAIRLEAEIDSKLPSLSYVPKIFISSLERQRVHKTVEQLLKIHEERQKRISTPELNRLLELVMEENPPPSHKGRDLRIHYVTQPASEPPLFVFWMRHAEFLAPHYKRYLERRLREQYGFTGVPIRLAFRQKT